MRIQMLIFIFILFVTSCTTTGVIEQDRNTVESGGKIKPVTPIAPTQTQQIELHSPTQTATKTPFLTQTSRLLPTPPAESIHIPDNRTMNGSIWLHEEFDRDFQRINLETGSISSINISRGCSPVLLPQQVKSLCFQDNAVNLYDYRMEKSETIIAKFEDTQIDWVYATSNGRFLFVGYQLTFNPDRWVYSWFDLFTYNKVSAITETKDLDWLVPPIISPDGEYIVGARFVGPFDNRIFDLSRSGESRQIGLDKPSATWDLAWSPVEPKLLYGASDINSEVGFYTNHLYLIDLNTKEVRLLAKSQNEDYYEMFEDDPIWSPSGKLIAVRSGNKICIIKVDESLQMCEPIGGANEIVYTFDWAPDSKLLVAVIGERGTRNNDVIILNIMNGEIVRLINDMGQSDAIYWRSNE